MFYIILFVKSLFLSSNMCFYFLIFVELQLYYP